jgi:hypothetical protein
MAARFVCPECGTPLASAGPGARARCPDCRAVVELPYLPRRPLPRRGRRASGSAGWAWVVIAVAAGVIGVLLTYQLVRSRVRDQQRRAFETLVTEAEADERAGGFERAVDRLAAALTLARAHRLAGEARLDELDGRRAELEARRDAARREAAEARAAADLDAARSALGGARAEPVRAIEACESAYAAARGFDAPRARELAAEARALAASLIRERGVDLPEPAGVFLDPAKGPARYVERVRPIVATHLEGRGYLPARPGSPLAELWPSEAPRRLVLLVNESHDGEYMDSVLKTSRLDLTLDLEQGGGILWHVRVTAKTREPSPRIPHAASAAFATARKRDPKAEARLYEDALEHLTGLLPARLSTMPAYVGGSPGG